ncbi:MAG TPA: hypothetical protein VHR66_29125 [Gemmataceae bacterium]|jgi:hypothetical protein|nr:hypothetical protein [Gemmataceae bacterium]
MLAHRFRELLETPEHAFSVASAPSAAFVPCPMNFAMSAMQHAQAEFLYRLAYEQAQAQLAARWPAFSLN